MSVVKYLRKVLFNAINEKSNYIMGYFYTTNGIKRFVKFRFKVFENGKISVTEPETLPKTRYESLLLGTRNTRDKTFDELQEIYYKTYDRIGNSFK